MIKRSEVQWRKLFEAHSRSGLSAVAFCRERKLCPTYFSLRRRQLLGGEQKPRTSSFVPARLVSAPSAIEIQAGVIRLRLPESVAAGWLAELVRGLSHADV